jgi:protein TonB
MNSCIPVAEQKSVCAQRRRVIGFVLGSLLLHVLLLVLWRGEPPAGPVGESTFQVTLVARHGDTAQDPRAVAERAGQNQSQQSDSGAEAAREPSKPLASSERQIVSATDPTTSARLVGWPASRTQQYAARAPERRRPAKAPTPLAAESQATTAVAAVSQAAVVATRGSTSHGAHELTSAARYRRVRDELLQALLPHFEYPPLARRRGWQGRVRIGLLVEADGHLSRVQLVESSGYTLLDKAAMKNVNQLRNVPGATQWLDGRDLDVVLPVSYRLEDR